MALVTRLSRLFQADFHAVLDRIEEPDLQLRQAVREMQFALDHDRQRLQLLQHEAEQLEQRKGTQNGKLQSLDDELDLCLAAEQEDLARDLVRRKDGTYVDIIKWANQARADAVFQKAQNSELAGHYFSMMAFDPENMEEGVEHCPLISSFGAV